MPIDPNSSRAWRFVWDQQFFEFCYAVRGSFEFDLDTYRQFDFATRRLFLFLKKIFWRRNQATADLCHLAVNVLGFSSAVSVQDLKIKVGRCLAKLIETEVVQLPETANTVADVFTKRGRGRYDVAFTRGAYFDRTRSRASATPLADSPAYDPLRTIGFDDAVIRHILTKYKAPVVQEWADITLAAVERKMVNKDPKAYFNYYITRAASGQTTPPDWWHQLRKQEERRRLEQQMSASPLIGSAFTKSQGFERAFEVFLESEAKDAFNEVMSKLTSDFTKAGQSDREAKQSAERFARQNLRNRFLADHPEYRAST